MNLPPDDREEMTLTLHEKAMAETILAYGKRLFQSEEGKARFQRWRENKRKEDPAHA